MNGKSRGRGWGFAAFAIPFGFIFFMLGMVMYATLQDVQLVEPGYYEKGLAYQEKIERIKRTDALPGTLEIVQDVGAGSIVLNLPAAEQASDLSGTVRLFRPSNARLDLVRSLALDDRGAMIIKTHEMARGLWLVEVDWKMDNEEYYTRKRVVIP